MPRTPPPSLEAIGLAALGHLVADEERLFAFLDATGIEPAALKAGARSPETLRAVLEHVLTNDTLVVGLAGELGERPERLAETLHRLTRAGEAD